MEDWMCLFLRAALFVGLHSEFSMKLKDQKRSRRWTTPGIEGSRITSPKLLDLCVLATPIAIAVWRPGRRHRFSCKTSIAYSGLVLTVKKKILIPLHIRKPPTRIEKSPKL